MFDDHSTDLSQNLSSTSRRIGKLALKRRIEKKVTFFRLWRIRKKMSPKKTVVLYTPPVVYLLYINGDVYKRLFTPPALVRRTHLGRSRNQLEYYVGMG